jgi:hypothetical protein
MMYFFGRGGVRHLGNFGGVMISGTVYERLRVEKNKKIDGVRRRYSRAGLEEVPRGEQRTRRLIIESHHLESTATAVPCSDRACPRREALRQLLAASYKWEGTIPQREDGADK